MKEKLIQSEFNNKTYKHLSFFLEKNNIKKMPIVLICHTWIGRGEFVIEYAKKLAKEGYYAVALDLFSDAKIAKNNTEAAELISEFSKDRFLSTKIIKTALEKIENEHIANINNLAVIGFCFGGMCALDFLRSGEKSNAIVSFHGLLKKASLGKKTKQSNILVMHGYEDPFVQPQELLDFFKEMKGLKQEWETCVYGNTLHGFTNPEANNLKMGIKYNKNSAVKSFDHLVYFLKRTLNK